MVPLATARGSVSMASRPLHGLNILETLFPSSELLGYYHALRTENSTFGQAVFREFAVSGHGVSGTGRLGLVLVNATVR